VCCPIVAGAVVQGKESLLPSKKDGVFVPGLRSYPLPRIFVGSSVLCEGRPG